jgi:Domain of unknown function (DUF4112)
MEDGMAQTHTPIFEAIKAAGPTRADSIARLEALSRLLDSAFLIPGTNQRVGIDALLGLIPAVGDLVSTALASYIIWEARQLGLPRWKIARMIGNVAVDTAVGAIPLAGDLFDVAFKANRRNMKILRDHLERTGGLPRTIEGQAARMDG